MIDLLYLAWNRLAYTQASFAALLRNTDWEHVHTLHVHDDASDDGTNQHLQHALDDVPGQVRVRYESLRLGSPVAVMNRHLDLAGPDELTGFVKIDNDFVVCPGWLPDLLRVVHLNPGIDVFGIAPQHGRAADPPVPDRGLEESTHIGGIGLIRHRVFAHCRPVVDGRFGWTEHQTRHPWVRPAWLAPAMPCFELDRLPIDPWQSLAEEYVAKGWARPWPSYPLDMGEHWDWWLERPAAA